MHRTYSPGSGRIKLPRRKDARQRGQDANGRRLVDVGSSSCETVWAYLPRSSSSVLAVRWGCVHRVTVGPVYVAEVLPTNNCARREEADAYQRSKFGVVEVAFERTVTPLPSLQLRRPIGPVTAPPWWLGRRRARFVSWPIVDDAMTSRCSLLLPRSGRLFRIGGARQPRPRPSGVRPAGGWLLRVPRHVGTPGRSPSDFGRQLKLSHRWAGGDSSWAACGVPFREELEQVPRGCHLLQLGLHRLRAMARRLLVLAVGAAAAG